MTSDTLVITAEARTDLTGSNTRKLRKNGLVPATIYGKNGTTNIAVPFKSFPQAHTTAQTLTLEVGGAKRTVLMREVQMDVLTKAPIHADFQEVAGDDVVLCQIPVEYTGLTKEQEKEASFKVLLRAVKVKGAVKKLPRKLSVEVGHLKAGETVFSKDLKLPEGVALRAKSSLALASLARM